MTELSNDGEELTLALGARLLLFLLERGPDGSVTREEISETLGADPWKANSLLQAALRQGITEHVPGHPFRYRMGPALGKLLTEAATRVKQAE